MKVEQHRSEEIEDEVAADTTDRNAPMERPDFTPPGNGLSTRRRPPEFAQEFAPAPPVSPRHNQHRREDHQRPDQNSRPSPPPHPPPHRQYYRGIHPKAINE